MEFLGVFLEVVVWSYELQLWCGESSLPFHFLQLLTIRMIPGIYSSQCAGKADTLRRPDSRMKRGYIGAVPVLVSGYRTWRFSLTAVPLSTQPTVDRTSLMNTELGTSQLLRICPAIPTQPTNCQPNLT